MKGILGEKRSCQKLEEKKIKDGKKLEPIYKRDMKFCLTFKTFMLVQSGEEK